MCLLMVSCWQTQATVCYCGFVLPLRRRVSGLATSQALNAQLAPTDDSGSMSTVLAMVPFCFGFGFFDFGVVLCVINVLKLQSASRPRGTAHASMRARRPPNPRECRKATGTEHCNTHRDNSQKTTTASQQYRNRCHIKTSRLL